MCLGSFLFKCVSNFIWTIDRAKVCVLYENDKIIGYTPSIKEAEALCDKHPEWQWDFKAAQKCIGVYKQLTTHDTSSSDLSAATVNMFQGMDQSSSN